MTVSSLLVPAAGLLTQPILAQALGVEGRGALAAAVAPAVLALAVATLGLPDALVYYLAKHPRFTRRALVCASGLTLAVGALCLLSVIVARPFLSAGDPGLGTFMVLAMALTVPALLVGVLRGAATGRQMWATVAVEKIVNSAIRIVAFVTLWATGELTVLSAVVVSALSPVVCGGVYWRLLLRPPDTAPADGPPDLAHEEAARLLARGVARPLLSFGGRVWLGAVAEMLLARVGQLLMTPLAGVTQLGLYSVASTISDLPLVVALAIQSTLFGVNSRTRDAGSLTATTRLSLFVALLGCGVLAATLPWWIGPLFGPEFVDATVPTLMLMLSAILCIPGLLAATGVSAWGRPGLRSLGLALTLATNFVALVLLVPALGAVGAACASIASNAVMTTYMVVTASRVMGVPAGDFVLVRRADVLRSGREALRAVRSVRSLVRDGG